MVRPWIFHKWAWQFLNSAGFWSTHSVISRSRKTAAISDIARKIGDANPNEAILHKNIQFYEEEISWIKGKLLSSLTEYQAVQRVGRGTQDRVTNEDKALLGSIFDAYQIYLATNSKVDLDDYANSALKKAV